MIKRLFDVIERQNKKFPLEVMMAGKQEGKWRKYSTAEVKETADKLSAGLIELGVSANDFTAEGSDKVAIIGNNRPEWVLADFAVQQTGAILVPLYPTTTTNEIEFILNDASVKYIFVSDRELFEKINAIESNIPSLQKIISFEKIEGVTHWSEIIAMANEENLSQVQSIKKQIPATHTATIIYTSGTTGVPKGVVLTHENICSNILFSIKSFPFYDSPGARGLSFLPLNHIFEKLITYVYFYSAYSIYYAESLDTLADNLKDVKPDMFTTVPRLLEKVFEKIMSAGSHLKGFKKKLFYWAVGLAEKYDTINDGGVWYNFQLALANKLIFKRWREALGGNVNAIITGGATCPSRILRVFNAARIPVYEGYGPTENSPVICVNRKTKGGNFIGTIGLPIEGIEVKLAEDGEICVRGATVMQGYYKRPDLTADVIIDGWLHTGDIGEWVVGKFLKIIDRKKELFKTSGGKYVSPQPIQNKFKENPLIEQIVVIGDNRKFVSALIVPAFENLQMWLKEKNIRCTNEEAVEKYEVIKLYQDILDDGNPQFNHVEQVKKFTLLPAAWSVESDELTPKLSIRRKVIAEKYKDYIEKMYEE